ncbi:hypothetical protein [Bdellovibrio sp.]|uniref:hypothetical protein n=1 Tax=Bdellovibrio sp. TaxID=28201 RepID=UPI0039E60713
MYTSWKALAVNNESEIQSSSRLKKVLWAKDGMLLPVIIMFMLASLLSLFLGGFFFYLSVTHYLGWGAGLGTTLVMIVMAILFAVGARLFHRERKMDLIRNYLLRPQDFEFVTGTLESFSYSYDSGGGVHRGRILVKGMARDSLGNELLALEQFSSRVWPFTTGELDQQIQEGDDWYSLKGKRQTLPIKAYFLCEKRNPRVAALVGIDKHFIEKALKSAEIPF